MCHHLAREINLCTNMLVISSSKTISGYVFDHFFNTGGTEITLLYFQLTKVKVHEASMT